MSTWAEQIIVAVIIATIIEMILPSGNNKKYIKAVIGVYILFTIISPILGKITNVDLDDVDYEKYFEEIDAHQAMSQDLASSNNKSIEDIYVSNLKQDMRAKLKEQGYEVEDISVNIELSEQSYGKINWIWLTLYKKDEEVSEEKSSTNAISVNKIEEVKIGNTNTNTASTGNKKEIKNSDKNEIKEYLAGVYELKKKNIKINE